MSLPPSTVPASTPTSRPLFGGAMSVSLPPRFVDVSPFRDIPDHQEVLADADTDQSLIVEVNHALPCADADAALAHMEALAADSASTDLSVLSTSQLRPTELPALRRPPTFAAMMVAEMRTSRYREEDRKANTVRVYLTLIRLREEESDVLILLNAPVQWGAGSVVEGKQLLTHQQNEEVVRCVLQSFTVLDYGLFGGPGGADERMAD